MTARWCFRSRLLDGGLCLAALCGLLLLALPTRAQSGPGGEPPEAETAFADALALYENRLYGSAQEAFADFHAAFPEHVHAPEALFYEARALLALGRGAAAARRLEELQAEDPLHPLAERAQLRLGRYFFRRGEDEDARRTLRRVLARRNADPERASEARFLLGALARRADRPDEALEQFRRVGERYPESSFAPRALYQTAAVHLEQDRTARAAGALEDLARRYPDAPQASSLGLALAEVYFDLERYGDVLSELERRQGALSTNEDRARAVFLRAEALRRSGGGRSQDRAASAYQQYLDRFAGGADVQAARYGLARIRYGQGSYPRATALFGRVAEGSASGGADAAMREQAAYFAAAGQAEAGNAQAAADAFGAFASDFPESPRRAEAQYRQGRTLLDAGRPAEAARVLRRLAGDDRFDRNAEARYLRSRALQADGRPAEALETLDAALAAGLPPEWEPRARFERGQLLLRAGRARAAADAFAAYQRRFPDGERGAEALYWEAESRYRTGALPQAAAGYQRYLQRQPEGPYAAAAQYGLGWASFQQENYGAAARAFERFLRRPDARASTYSRDAALRLGDSHFARRRFAEAQRAYDRAGGEARDYALYQTGQARSRTDDTAGAIDAWQTLVQDFPESALQEEARFQIGQAHFQEERYDEAIRAWRDLVNDATEADDALAARAQYSIGDALYNQGRSADAARAYRAVLENYPESAFASDAARGVALAAESDPDAGDALDTLDPDAADEVRFRQAETQYQRGESDAARRAFQRFVRTSSREDLLPQAYYYLGTLYAEAGQYREAEGYLRQVLADYPDSDRRADAAARLGALYLEEDAPQRALDTYEQMQTFDAGNDRLQARARYGQGRALAALGRTAEAEERLREAAERAPDAPVAQEARVARARLYADTGRPDEATTLYRRVAESSQSDAGAEALYRLGALLLDQGRPEAAVEELSRLPDLFSGFPEWIARGLLAQAQAFRALGRTGQASQLYDRLQEEFAGTEEARLARQEQEAL